MIGVSGLGLTADEKKFIVANDIGGVVLFARNLSEPKQIHALCREIQSLRRQTGSKTPFFIGVDMEGGRIAQLKAPFTQWPALKKLGDLDAPTVSFHFSNRMGLELSAVGINLDFAPCVDVFTNPKNTVIGDRALSTDPEMVAKHASALIRGYTKAGVLSCAKHFPGHGDTIVDSHDDLPVEQANLAQLEARELIPFKKSFKARVDMVMTAHILFPKVDKDWPVTLSEIFLRKMIREEFRYRGLIAADDLDMSALAKHYDPERIAVRALQAGNDLLLYCHDPKPDSAARALENINRAISAGELKKEDLEASRTRILAVKKDKILRPDGIPFSEAIQFIGNPEHLKLAQSIAKGEMPDGLLAE